MPIEWKDLLAINEINDSENLDKNSKLAQEDTYVEPFFATKKQLEQYCNEDLYRIEKDFLEWAHKKMETDKGWNKSGVGGSRARAYTMSMLLQEIYGRPWNKDLDSKYRSYYTAIAKYYSTTIKKDHYCKEKGKMVNNTEYRLSMSRLRKCMPYSLRLRYEKYLESGTNIKEMNLELVEDKLKIGHSRNPKTEKSRERRSKLGREKYEKWLAEHIK